MLKRTSFIMVAVMVVSLISVAGAATIEWANYNSTNTDWYASGMTAAGNGAGVNGLKTDTSVTSSIKAFDYQGWGYPVIASGQWAGATWDVPEGGAIAQFSVSGYFWNGGNKWKAAVYGIDSEDRTVLLWETPADIYVNSANARSSYSNQTVTLDLWRGYKTLQFRAWENVTSTTIAHANGYDGYMNAVSIAYTVPEPATMALLGLGGIVSVIRRKRK